MVAVEQLSPVFSLQPDLVAAVTASSLTYITFRQPVVIALSSCEIYILYINGIILNAICFPIYTEGVRSS